ncbi:hypothetical protein [Streptomyces sp. NPDC094149]|uniref:hypothetical protein n=1 Tax=Streptomyces sp. NPDC094149 TaxID=3155079 RepID=UPI003322843C
MNVITRTPWYCEVGRIWCWVMNCQPKAFVSDRGAGAVDDHDRFGQNQQPGGDEDVTVAVQGTDVSRLEVAAAAMTAACVAGEMTRTSACRNSFTICRICQARACRPR